MSFFNFASVLIIFFSFLSSIVVLTSPTGHIVPSIHIKAFHSSDTHDAYISIDENLCYVVPDEDDPDDFKSGVYYA